MSGNRRNRGRRRACSPYYYDTSITTMNAAKDSIRKMQAALDEEWRTVTTLHGERDEAQNRARIWERDLMILCKDHRRLQASFSRLTLRFTDLQARILEEHPEFPIIRVRGHGPSREYRACH
jgi:hypothetical protein